MSKDVARSPDVGDELSFLVNRDGTVKLADFGASRNLSKLSSSSQSQGAGRE